MEDLPCRKISGLAGTINPDRIGWDLQIIGEQKWIVCVQYGREFRWGKWPYSEKQALQSQLIDGKLILDCQQPPVVDVGTTDLVKTLLMKIMLVPREERQKLVDDASERECELIVFWIRSPFLSEGSLDCQRSLNTAHDHLVVSL